MVRPQGAIFIDKAEIAYIRRGTPVTLSMQIGASAILKRVRYKSYAEFLEGGKCNAHPFGALLIIKGAPATFRADQWLAVLLRLGGKSRDLVFKLRDFTTFIIKMGQINVANITIYLHGFPAGTSYAEWL